LADPHRRPGPGGRRLSGGVSSLDMAPTALTSRQQEVLDLWLADTPYHEIARRLGISTKTVNPHLKAIARKLGAAGISRDSLRAAVEPAKPGGTGSSPARRGSTRSSA
jgi:DNA-binding CsgD family transcriptional regulator